MVRHQTRLNEEVCFVVIIIIFSLKNELSLRTCNSQDKSN